MLVENECVTWLSVNVGVLVNSVSILVACYNVASVALILSPNTTGATSRGCSGSFLSPRTPRRVLICARYGVHTTFHKCNMFLVSLYCCTCSWNKKTTCMRLLFTDMGSDRQKTGKSHGSARWVTANSSRCCLMWYKVSSQIRMRFPSVCLFAWELTGQPCISCHLYLSNHLSLRVNVFLWHQKFIMIVNWRVSLCPLSSKTSFYPFIIDWLL